ncbi:MAG: hypothetical protein VKQ33_04635 [Candidatus Sericytochromatia bacterium]|nr:hypothetical protein [Candidatus Sericytochromatia bacterium]
MALNLLSKLNIGRAFITEARATVAEQGRKVAPALARRAEGDAFVKSTRPGTGLLNRASTGASTGVPARALADQNLGFAELVARNPGMIWNTQLTPRTEQAIKAFAAGTLGASVKGLDLRNRTADEVRSALARRGFLRELSHLRDVRTGQPVLNPRTGKPVPMEIWTHRDGGMVRIKPEGDPTSRHRPLPHLSIAVLYPPGASGHDFNNEAFKVDFAGNALPKWAADARNPYPAASPAGKRFLDDLAGRTHINLR